MHNFPQSLPFFGETLAIANAVIWAYSVILFKMSGKEISPVALNIFKITIGVVLMLIVSLFMPYPLFPKLGWQAYTILATSGILGIALSDTLFFRTLNILGASRCAIVECLYSPFVILFSFIFLGERLTFVSSIGAVLVVSSLFLLSGEGRKDKIDQKALMSGIIAGILSMSTMGFAIVIVKPVLMVLPVVWVAMARMFFGVIALSIFSFFQSDRKKTWGLFFPQKIWKIALPACFLGSFITMLLWVGSFKFATANIAAILTQLNIVFTVFFAWIILKEPITKRKIISVILAIFGSILVVS